MADTPSGGELREDYSHISAQQNKDLERMVENMEKISVQLTWMAYDMVVLRTGPEVGDSLRRLKEEFLKCKAVICDSPAKQDREEFPVPVDHSGT